MLKAEQLNFLVDWFGDLNTFFCLETGVRSGLEEPSFGWSLVTSELYLLGTGDLSEGW